MWAAAPCCSRWPTSNLVQVRTLVDETDIGKIQPGQRATVTVDAYPNRPFQGAVLKIEPQAQTEQNVTMFPVLVRIDNKEGLLRPGMNAEVEIHVGRRDSVLAVPNAALRTQRDVGSAAQVLGLRLRRCSRQLAADSGAAGQRGSGGSGTARRARGDHRGVPPDSHVRPALAEPERPPRCPAAPLDRGAATSCSSTGRQADPGLDPDRPHRSGLQRGGRGADRVRLGAGAAEREPGAVAAGVPGAGEPDHGRRACRECSNRRPSLRGGARP